MSEAEITYQISEYLNRIWMMQQWWASISIGVLVMAHLASSRLNLLLVSISLGLYTAYTLYMLQMSGENYDSVVALARDLQLLLDSGAVQSYSARDQIEIMDANPALYYVTFGGTYISVAAYLIYSYFKARGSERG